MERDIGEGRINGWDDLHDQYRRWGGAYSLEKLRHSAACWFELAGKQTLTGTDLAGLIRNGLKTAEELLASTRRSREKDYTQRFRFITFDTPEERDAVLGRLEDDSFIEGQEKEFSALSVACEEFLQAIGRQ